MRSSCKREVNIKISGLGKFCKKNQINKYGIKDFLRGTDLLGGRRHKVN